MKDSVSKLFVSSLLHIGDFRSVPKKIHVNFDGTEVRRIWTSRPYLKGVLRQRSKSLSYLIYSFFVFRNLRVFFNIHKDFIPHCLFSSFDPERYVLPILLVPRGIFYQQELGFFTMSSFKL